MTKYLIVNADDYGIAASVSQGIRESHQRGIVTSTTVMVGMDNAAEAVGQALNETPDLALGLHLTVAGKAMKPVLPPDEIPTLVRPDGFFYDHPAWGEQAPFFNPDEMMRELQAQFDRFVALAHQLPTHMDSHYHATYFHPTPAQAMRSLALKHNLPLRHDRGIGASIVEGIPHPVAFYELDHDQPIEVLLSFLQTLPDGEIVELCCHPGYSNDTLFDTDPWTTVREIDLAYLTDPRVQAVIASEQITLCNFDVFKK
jgi:chitin disaccharide deacetylase